MLLPKTIAAQASGGTTCVVIRSAKSHILPIRIAYYWRFSEWCPHLSTAAGFIINKGTVFLPGITLPLQEKHPVVPPL
jgi:hypothetical protein